MERKMVSLISVPKSTFLLYLALFIRSAYTFLPIPNINGHVGAVAAQQFSLRLKGIRMISNQQRDQQQDQEQKNKEKKKRADPSRAMDFLRKIGKAGGHHDFTNAIGIDEGPADGRTSPSSLGGLSKTPSAFRSCVDSGIIDDLSEPFPWTSSGTRWSGFTDRVMGGISTGSLTKRSPEEEDNDRAAYILRGTVSLANNGGFVQMATDLFNNNSAESNVDASEWDGVELDILSFQNEDETFNVHLKNGNCLRQFSSYRAPFRVRAGTTAPGSSSSSSWQTIRLSWSDFEGKGPGADGTPFDPTTLRRLGIVAIGKEMTVHLAVGGVRFYKTGS